MNSTYKKIWQKLFLLDCVLKIAGSAISWIPWNSDITQGMDDGFQVNASTKTLHTWYTIGRQEVKEVKVAGHLHLDTQEFHSFFPNQRDPMLKIKLNASTEILFYKGGSTSWIPVAISDINTEFVEANETPGLEQKLCRFSSLKTQCGSQFEELNVGYLFEGNCWISCYGKLYLVGEGFEVLVKNVFGRFLDYYRNIEDEESLLI